MRKWSVKKRLFYTLMIAGVCLAALVAGIFLLSFFLKKPVKSYQSLGEVEEACQQYWQENLGAEVKYWGKKEIPTEGNGQVVELTFYTVDPDYFITIHKTYITYTWQEGVIHIEDEKQVSFDKVKNGEMAEAMGEPEYYYWWPWSMNKEDNGAAGNLQNQGMVSGADIYLPLLEPETALPLLLRLEGGSSRKRAEDYHQTYVTYTFDDGSHINYVMRKGITPPEGFNEGTFWFPAYIVSDEELEEEILAHEYVEQADVEELKALTEVGGEKSETWKFDNQYVLIDFIENEDVAIYGLYGGRAMVLREGNRIFPLYMGWISPQMILPKIYYGDYDKDGTREIALHTLMGTGTGLFISQLYMIEINKEDICVNQFGSGDFSRFTGRITDTWEDENRMLYFAVDGKPIEQVLHLPAIHGSETETFKKVIWGNYIEFTETAKGQWMLTAEAGLASWEWAWPDYHEIIASAPVNYHKDGSFSVGEINLTIGEN